MNDEYLDFAKGLAEEAGRVMKRYFVAEEMGLEIKEDRSPVTAADTEINALVIKRVKDVFPGHGVIGEEDGFDHDSKQLWIVDPIDGTFNFANGLPGAVFSLAFVEDGIAQVGVIYDPLLDRLFWAAASQGAYENERKLDLPEATRKGKFIISSWLAGGINGTLFQEKDLQGKSVSAYNNHGNIFVSDWPVAHALALVAGGRLDGIVTSCKNSWDLAAGGLIAREAGAKVTDIFGNPISRWNRDINGIVAAPPSIHKLLLEVIRPVTKEAKVQ
jgi:myo-inositol-1(or 4)-monophosphatase